MVSDPVLVFIALALGTLFYSLYSFKTKREPFFWKFDDAKGEIKFGALLYFFVGLFLGALAVGFFHFLPEIGVGSLMVAGFFVGMLGPRYLERFMSAFYFTFKRLSFRGVFKSFLGLFSKAREKAKESGIEISKDTLEKALGAGAITFEHGKYFIKDEGGKKVSMEELTDTKFRHDWTKQRELFEAKLFQYSKKNKSPKLTPEVIGDISEWLPDLEPAIKKLGQIYNKAVELEEAIRIMQGMDEYQLRAFIKDLVSTLKFMQERDRKWFGVRGRVFYGFLVLISYVITRIVVFIGFGEWVP